MEILRRKKKRSHTGDNPSSLPVENITCNHIFWHIAYNNITGPADDSVCKDVVVLRNVFVLLNQWLSDKSVNYSKGLIKMSVKRILHC